MGLKLPRVLHVFKLYYPEKYGGVQRAIYEIANHTVDHGFEPTVFALSSQPSQGIFNVGRHKAMTVKQQLYVASTGFSFAALKTFQTLAADADIIHYHFPWPFMDLLHLFSGVKKPSIVTYHSDIVKQGGLLQFYKPFMHRFLKDMNRIVATSPNYVQTSEVLQRYRNKTTVIPLSIPTEECSLKPDIVEKWRSKTGEGFFLYLGALRYYKGLSVVLEAARQTGLQIVIAGTGEQAKSLTAMAPRNVFFTGHYSDDDRAALLSLARAFVFPSNMRSEAFGISLLEAARASKALISCEIGTGTSYINKDGVTGLVIPPNDPVALASAMQRLNASPDMAAQLGRAARQRFEGMFTAPQMAASYAAQYDALLENSRC